MVNPICVQHCVNITMAFLETSFPVCAQPSARELVHTALIAHSLIAHSPCCTQTLLHVSLCTQPYAHSLIAHSPCCTQTLLQVSLCTQPYAHSLVHSLIPRPCPAFRRLQYGKAGRAWYLFSREHDLISKLRKFAKQAAFRIFLIDYVLNAQCVRQSPPAS